MDNILDIAKSLVEGDRQNTYGTPLQCHQNIADYWNVLLKDKLNPDFLIEAEDVAQIMKVILKLFLE